MSEKIDIIRVAREAGVSIATVSRAFTLPHKVKQSTREAIFAVVEQIGYTPSARARNFRSAKTGLIVTLVPEITDPFFSGILQGIETAARHHGYCVLIGEARRNASAAARYTEMLAEGAVDGMITMYSATAPIRGQTHPAVVSLCEVPLRCAYSSVAIDNEAAMRQATRYLIDAGHRRIAHLGAHVGSPSGVGRLRGYRAAMRAAGLSGLAAVFSVPEKSLAAGEQLAEQVLAAADRPTACVCNSDELAIGLIHGLRRRGLEVPRDMSVFGFDGIAMGAYASPGLTTIVQPCERMGREALLRLLEVIQDPGAPARKIVLATALLERGSVGPPSLGAAVKRAPRRATVAR